MILRVRGRSTTGVRWEETLAHGSSALKEVLSPKGRHLGLFFSIRDLCHLVGQISFVQGRNPGCPLVNP